MRLNLSNMPSLSKSLNHKDKKKILKNQFGDVILDEEDQPVYEMQESKHLTRDEINNILQEQKKVLEKRKKELEQWEEQDRAVFKGSFGSSDETSRQKILMAINKEIEINEPMTYDKCRFADKKCLCFCK
ncbi:hypothetical protein [Chimaeribacter coloradensis]|uniref:hypothetical protein n=1 Tax=Chimaeribacter coloradensis TaxID=2060068 RepID=UPI0011AF6EB6|nr:hypothetical protein [Chimaeribacter coloradensis]